MYKIIAVVPKLALTGGNLEVERLLGDLESLGMTVVLLPVFARNTNKFFAILAAPYFYIKLTSHLVLHRPNLLILTHFSTLPFGIIQFFCRTKTAVFVQGLEWLFPSPNAYIQLIMKAYHMIAYSSMQYLVFGNIYLKNYFLGMALGTLKPPSHPPAILYPVGSISRSLSLPAEFDYSVPSYDIGLILRNGWLKNQQAYFDVLVSLFDLGCVEPSRVSAISMLNSTISSSKYSAIGLDVRPKMSHRDLCVWMSSLKIFLCLSIHEGFGLPPLEAMALGVVPLVLSNGGCSSYMSDFPELIIPPNSSPQAIVDKIFLVLSWSEEYRANKVNLLKTSAQHYLSWASKARQEGAYAISSIVQSF